MNTEDAGAGADRWYGPNEPVAIAVTLNGAAAELRATARQTLADAVREHGLTGTHLGCEHGVCGACTVLLDDRPVRSCLVLAVQAAGCRVETVEGLATAGALSPLQQAFHEGSALQCGFCTPGFLMLASGVLRSDPGAPPDRLAEAMTANLCRCTGGPAILAAVRAAQDSTRRGTA